MVCLLVVMVGCLQRGRCGAGRGDHVKPLSSSELRFTPRVRAPRVRVASVSVGMEDVCAIRSEDGRVVCWNLYGQDAAPGLASVPAELGAATAIDVQGGHACAIREKDRQVLCWGTNKLGQTDVPPELDEAVAIAVAGNFSCAIRARDGRVLCWGLENSEGRNPPEGLDRAVAIASRSAYMVCAVRARDRQQFCWPWWPLHENLERLRPVEDMMGVYDPYVTCAVRQTDHMVLCLTKDSIMSAPEELGIPVALTTGGFGICAIRASDRALLCWGMQDDSIPDFGPVKAVSLGYSGGCVIRNEDDGLVCWTGRHLLPLPAELGGER